MMLKKLALLAVMAVLALPSPSQAANEKIKILSYMLFQQTKQVTSFHGLPIQLIRPIAKIT